MSSIGLDPTSRDIYVLNNDLVISTGIESTLEICERSVKTLRRELIYSQNGGINYDGLVWSGVPNLILLENEIRQTILSVEGVIRIVNFNIELLGDSVSYSAEILTNFGVGALNG